MTYTHIYLCKCKGGNNKKCGSARNVAAQQEKRICEHGNSYIYLKDNNDTCCSSSRNNYSRLYLFALEEKKRNYFVYINFKH